ncbi:hypothetical protein OZX73_00825 [Bifidobacterium sp. ESL0775]|uniref:helix-turn-helix transcriptional regulator n=1 Tax=Bifidobacterium sp. ESL0775 TaxID=2983230 RepID=UPI0023FA4B2B|nr:hypothetical protein [Bifidobacterium sp. ESL0775]WEV69475.1 hypothetical protein OZX73_00825 [Bifidobacterium sp. ESL0775]
MKGNGPTDIYTKLMGRIEASPDPRKLRMTTDEASAYIPISKQQLAQMRYRGTGPRYLKPSPRTVLYCKGDVDDWLASSVRVSTADVIDNARMERR